MNNTDINWDDEFECDGSSRNKAYSGDHTVTMPATVAASIANRYIHTSGWVWAAWRNAGCPDDSTEPRCWSELVDQMTEAMSDLTHHYWATMGSSSMEWEFRERLETLNIFEFTTNCGRLTCRIDDPDNGNIELRMVRRAGGALYDVVAYSVCPVCHEGRSSLPITSRIHLVAFAIGTDSPCSCRLRQQIRSEQAREQEMAERNNRGN